MRRLSLHTFLRGRDSRLAMSMLGPPSGRLLDIGGGEGEDLRMLLEQGWQAVGLDPFQGGGEAPWVRATAEQVPFKDESFDVVTCVLVLPHLPHPDRALAEVFRVLRTEGRAAFVVFSRSPLNMRAAIRRDGYSLIGRSFPYRLFSKRELWSLLQRAGFISLAWTRTDFLPMLTGWLPPSSHGRILAWLQSVDERLTNSLFGPLARKLIVIAGKGDEDALGRKRGGS